MSLREKIRTLLFEAKNTEDYQDFWDAMWSGNSIQYRDVLEHYVPQLKMLKGLPQNTHHHPEGDVDVHVYLVIDEVAKYHDKDISLGALFHDIGKLDTYRYDEEKGHTYHGHEDVSLIYVKYYKDLIEDSGGSYYIVYDLVAQHMKFHRPEQMKDSHREHMKSKGHYDKLKKLCDADDSTKRK